MPTAMTVRSVLFGHDGALPPTVQLAPDAPSITWTDDPVTTETPIRAVHVNELRRAIDRRRRMVGLAAFRWTDDPVIARYTVVKAVHFLELRGALQEAWTRSGHGDLPAWTCGSPPSTERVVFASDVNDLRRWVNMPEVQAASNGGI